MQAPRTLKALFAALLALSSLAAAASDRAAVTVTVAGVGKCTDCAKKDVMRGDAFKGLRVAVICKNSKGGEYKTSAVAALSNNGEFSVELPSELLGNDNGGGLKEECFAELRSASRKPCPSSNGIESSKIVRKHSEDPAPTRKKGKRKRWWEGVSGGAIRLIRTVNPVVPCSGGLSMESKREKEEKATKQKPWWRKPRQRRQDNLRNWQILWRFYVNSGRDQPFTN
ncbi:hypothetical protein QJS10_CPB21g00159 [Acorus calamus]|uniref:Uncharacterized protein n=1 Tax=Acorus calamus TaxID=4465 RepID=A0AAV9C3Y4_ACOCL|nr:hypothetical protein QJS10_CPB21g00159 [Acorus calamus]